MTDCMLWAKYKNGNGYGEMYLDGSPKLAHRIIYEAEVGEIPEGLQVLHKCDMPPCINVEHLFLGTHQDNMRDKTLKGRCYSPNANKQACSRGHLFTPNNTTIRKNGKRECRSCNNARNNFNKLIAKEERPKKPNKGDKA